MILDYLTLFIAFVISTTGAFYSISGLTAIFAAAYWPIVIMGSVLEFGKVLTTMWLRKNWKYCKTFIKSYLIVCVVILMLITNMGIYGFLSKAHLDQAAPTGDVQAEITQIDQEISGYQTLLQQNQQQLQIMDRAVTESLNRTSEQFGVDRSVQIRKSQQSERTLLNKENTKLQTQIQEAQKRKTPLSAKMRAIELEVGPLKYISALIYGENVTSNALEQSVRWVIILLVMVFDPLALALVLAVNHKLDVSQLPSPEPAPTIPTPEITPQKPAKRKYKKRKPKKPVETESTPTYVEVVESAIPSSIQEIPSEPIIETIPEPPVTPDKTISLESEANTSATISLQELVRQVTTGKIKMEQLSPSQKQKVRKYLNREKVLGK